ncbi:MAG: oxidoreductase [Rhodocyclaceae bacterium]|nr:oxidoreductase [Rhodocyclaceae bacterium]
MTDFHGKTVLITGGCGTVGRACMETFLAKGANIALTDGVPPTSTLSLPPHVEFCLADVTDPDAVTRAYDSFINRFGHIDAAVLAAGIEGAVAPLEEISEQDLDAVWRVNVKGCLSWMQLCLRDMKARNAGSIVALSSISGVVGTPLLGPYTISKHAVVGLVKTAALEAGPHGVRVNAVCPGPIQSPMMERLDQAFVARDPNRLLGQRDASKSLPLQRYVSAAEVAAMVAFLCSDDAGSCHGGIYMVDGGFTAK